MGDESLKRLETTMVDGETAPFMEDALKHHQEAAISKPQDMPYMEYINRMLNSACEHKSVERQGCIVHMLRFNTPVGVCYAWLYQKAADGTYFDFSEYQLWATGRVVSPTSKTMSTPKEFCQQFLFPKAEYAVLCAGRKNRIKKPEVLRGVKKFASVSFAGRNQCQLFLNGQDLYIRHGDYFSPTYCKPEDNGTPLMYRLKKYGMQTKFKEKHIYMDCWGAIVLRRIAWIRISNFVPLLRHLNDVEMAAVILSMIWSYHHWEEGKQNEEWKNFLMSVAKATRKKVGDV